MQIKVKYEYYEQETPERCAEKGDLKCVNGCVIDNHCCPDMAHHWGVTMGFGFYRADAAWNTGDKMYLYRYLDSGEYKGYYDEHEIAFCPFCGEAIEYAGGGR